MYIDFLLCNDIFIHLLFLRNRSLVLCGKYSFLKSGETNTRPMKITSDYMMSTIRAQLKSVKLQLFE